MTEKPDYVKSFVQPPKTEIKKIGNGWYLYERSSVYDPKTKRSRKVSGKYLGKITETGLQKTERRLTKISAAVHTAIINDTVDAGSTLFFYERTAKLRARLKKYFPSLWKNIYVVSLLRLIYGPRFKRLQLHYESSFLSYLFPDLSFYPDSNRDLLQEVGKQREAISQFMKEDISDGQLYILFDGHRLITSSRTMPFAELGYDSKRRFKPQINLIYIYSLGEDAGAPVYYKQYIGSTPDVVAFADILKETKLKKEDYTVIADKGFASESDFLLLEESGLNYIIPLRRGNKYTKDKIPTSPREYQECFNYHKRAICSSVYHYDGFNIFTYHDTQLFAREAADASIRADKNNNTVEKIIEAEQKRRKKGKGKLTNDEFEKLKPTPIIDIFKERPEMGSITIKTNRTELNSRQVFCLYKQRQAIEQFYKTYGDTMEFEASYMRDQTSEEAWLFLNHLSAMIGVECIMEIGDMGESKDVSLKDVLQMLCKITASKIDNQWQMAPIKKSVQNFLNLFDFAPSAEKMNELLAAQAATVS